MFVSVPYDKGWKVCVDGKVAEIIPVMEEGFMAVMLENAGEHEVIMEYKVPGLFAGFIISVFTGIGFLVVCIVSCKKKHIKTD